MGFAVASVLVFFMAWALVRVGDDDDPYPHGTNNYIQEIDKYNMRNRGQ